MSTHNHYWGVFGEQLAAAYLNRQGYQMLTTNWRCHRQEIDLIAWQQTILVLVEVKLRLTNSFGLATDALSQYKLKQIKLAANYAIRLYRPQNWRYDFIAIDLNLNKHLARLCHYRQII